MAVATTAIDVTGIPQARSLLRRFDPDLLKRLDSRLNAVARDLRAGAQTKFSSTGVTADAYRIRTRSRVDGFSKSVTTKGGSVAAGRKWSSEPGVLAAIFELMAGPRDAQPQNVPRVRSLIATLNARYGAPGRFLWEEWDESGDRYLAEVRSAVAATEAEYSAKLRAV